MKLIEADSAHHIAIVRQLFEEYASWIEISLCFQNFDRELATLPGDYSPPSGRLFIALEDEQPAGCVALRKINEQAAEMKRLYVRPEFRGQGVGHELTKKVLDSAKEIGYTKIRLDTIPGKMDQAIKMYRSLGFKEIPPYYRNPVEGATFMELNLYDEPQL